jgi:RNA polymerase subunit RPABC4/transcription elongation factor Spt4
MFVTGETCSCCGGSSFTQTFQGKVTIVNPEKSYIAKQLGISVKGDYALKIR